MDNARPALLLRGETRLLMYCMSCLCSWRCAEVRQRDHQSSSSGCRAAQTAVVVWLLGMRDGIPLCVSMYWSNDIYTVYIILPPTSTNPSSNIYTILCPHSAPDKHLTAAYTSTT
ncbi:hypothetical protein BCV70DRAFT_100183 [Testicularia cyperi]|uniref:Uncharacterized protein n=1 Tax=Testicularia cyperi TaxID=1882483 RepID=A0A317XR62_9BASI|nr:hypothetical protein BCV70DRAFT_100183 [Testicularia cyperi]